LIEGISLSTPVFFVQNNRVDRLTAPVAIHARANGIELQHCASSNLLDVDAIGIDWSQHHPVLPYGSVQFLRKCKESSLARYILHDETCFANSTWAPFFGEAALNFRGRRITTEQVADAFANSSRIHVRPGSVDKAFAGDVFDSATWGAVVAKRELAGDLACWASPPQDIVSEWRCWIVDGQVHEVCQYRHNGTMLVRPDARQHIRKEAQDLAGLYLPANCVVLDMALTSDGYKLIEFNPIHCSGWYKADVSKVLGAWMDWSMKHDFSEVDCFRSAPAEALRLR
jgi:hypothetical protein